MSADDGDVYGIASTGTAGWVTQYPLAFGLTLVALYWAVKVLRPASALRPPRAPYWIPWVGSALELGKDPDVFLGSMTKLLGPVFRVKTLGREMVFVTSPSLISTIYRDSEAFDFLSVRLQMGEQVFSIRKDINSAPYTVDFYIPELHRILLPNNLRPMISLYLSSAHDSLLSMITNMDGASGPLKTFVILPAYRAASHAGFGLGFPADKSYPYFKIFDDNIHLLAAGLPHFLLSKPTKAWHELLDMIEAYVKEQDQSGQDMTNFLLTALEGHRRGEWTYRDVATVLASQLWALHANVIFVAYWLIAMLLQQPEGLTPIVSELDAARRQWHTAHPSTPLGPAFFDEVTSSTTSLPLLSSAIQETLRYAGSPSSMRRVAAPVTLGGYQLRVGDNVVCAMRCTHIDEDIHPRADEFDMRRYLKTPRAMKDGKVVSNHTMPFGGGVSMCEGRHFAMAELKLFAAILLTYATIDIDESCTTRPEFVTERMGLGILHPRGDMEVILRKRKL